MEKLWERLFMAVVIIAVAAVLFVAGSAIMAPHTVQQYYVSHPSNGNSLPGYCVMASINWDFDNVVFCSDDITKVTGEVDKLNQTLHQAAAR